MYMVNPKDIEKFHLRLLLLHVRVAQCFDDLKSYNGKIYKSYL